MFVLTAWPFAARTSTPKMSQKQSHHDPPPDPLCIRHWPTKANDSNFLGTSRGLFFDICFLKLK